MLLHDKDIREPLFEYLEETFGKVRILEEKTMGRSRADVVMVTTDALIGIEIKSDADTYARLARQVKDYDKYYDYNYAVIGSTHGHHIREHIPPYWGVITVELIDGCFDFYVLRKPAPNPKVKLAKQLEILWRPELAALQKQNQMPKYSNRGKAFVIRKLMERVDAGIIEKKALKKQISDLLFERDYTIFE
ncbi:MAG: sce7726 family protein [Lachnospiraceae bacterium]|nr:sce7726 family protein [Lachnospiraceae bacterium]